MIMALSMAACGSSSTSSEGVVASYSDINLDDYITVGEYKGLKVAPYVIKVSKEEIQAAVDKDLDAAKEKKELDKGAELKDGDTANIDYVGSIDGKKFEGGSAEGHDLELGSGQFIDGFESGLVGKKVGEKVDLNVTFPEDYGAADLAGKDAVFAVTINSATRPSPITEEQYVEKNNLGSIEDYEKNKKAALKAEKENTAKTEQRTELWSQLLENTDVKEYPQEAVDAYLAVNNQQVEDLAKQYNMSKEDYIKRCGFKDEAEMQEVSEQSAKMRIKQEMLLEVISAKEGLECTDEDMEGMKQQMEASGYTDELVKQQTGMSFEQYARNEVLYQKVLDFVLENAKIEGSAKEY